MSDQVIQVNPDSSGKKIDVTELTRADGTVVERERVNISDPNFTTKHASVLDGTPTSDLGALLVQEKRGDETNELLLRILLQLQTLTERITPQ